MPLRGRLPIIALLVVLLGVVFVSGAASLTSLNNLSRGDFPVRVAIATSGSLANGSFMPGALLGPLELRITADGNLEYGLRPTITGSAALADALWVEIHDEAGSPLYAGPLRDTAFSDYFCRRPRPPARRWCDRGSDRDRVHRHQCRQRDRRRHHRDLLGSLGQAGARPGLRRARLWGVEHPDDVETTIACTWALASPPGGSH